MTKKITKLMLNGQEYEIREYQEPGNIYSFDFTQGYDGWTISEGGLNVGVNGINGTSSKNTIYNTNIDISGCSHLVYKTRFMSTNVGSRTGTVRFGFQDNPVGSNQSMYEVYNGLMTNSGYKCRFNDMSGLDINLGDLNWVQSQRYTGVMEIDITNGTGAGTYKIYENDESGTLVSTYNISGDITGATTPVIVIERDYVYVSNAEITLS